MNQGYWFVSVNGKKRAQHRVVMERKLGRKLDRQEIVHHIDWDRFNNDEENLMLVTRAEHMRLHFKGQRQRRWTQEEKDRASELRKSGMTIQDVATAIGRPYISTRNYLAASKTTAAD